MRLRINIAVVLTCSLVFFSFSPVKRYIKKAELNIERGNLELAKKYYEKALALQPENIRANYGLGMMYCELLDNYVAARPLLEKANTPPIEDSLYDMIFALGKCYQHSGEAEKAISYFDRLQFVVDLDEEKDFKKELSKRKDDCRYFIAHRDEMPSPNMHVVNGGRTINTDMPEYVPVLLPGNKMIFTSKRKDDEKEKINYLDGKYFESMYICDVTPTGFRNTRRYTIPDQHIGKRRKSNQHESVISLSQDGTKLFTFKKGNIYEIKVTETEHSNPKKLESFVNENIYENHAYLSRDGRQLYFSVEAESSLGGTDIYLSLLQDDGKWSIPENLGETVNTPYDEDAPFLSPDGQTLFFASTGHPGYGNFDLYKSEKKEGKWSAPVNLGKPLNSPGHDLFLVNDTANATAYFASGRNGGFGDLDIYKVLYLDKIDTLCDGASSALITMEARDVDSSDYSNIVAVNLPPNYKVLRSQWQLNGETITADTTSFEHNYKVPGTYTITSKVIALCDTCLSPLVACNSFINTLNNVRGKETDTSAIVKNLGLDINTESGELSDEQLRKIGFDPEPVIFGFDQTALTFSTKLLLDSNLVVLAKNDRLKVHVLGYTDSRGPASYNQALSERRAKAVVAYLEKHGLDRSRITMVEGKGETDLVNDCNGSKYCGETEHRKNRRVRLIVLLEKISR
jgi:outer membrane protein OmpA-like peptidoglycan-associated protein/tetratricopeptide (TPR) repeat protein